MLQHHLPRPHAAHALLMLALIDSKTHKPRGPSEFDLTGKVRRNARGLPADGQFLDSAAWQMWRALEGIAKPRGVCVRRVCDKAAATVCAKCGTAEYCGEDCEKRCVCWTGCGRRADRGCRDRKEHKIMCGVIDEPGSG